MRAKNILKRYKLQIPLYAIPKENKFFFCDLDFKPLAYIKKDQYFHIKNTEKSDIFLDSRGHYIIRFKKD